ncbi:MAG: phosphoenolpyruvate carboxykinase (GTP) [Candidatus Lokiarchaeota archaeon]|nr:phosphoenolpyruvate carboxykinase (GTP) [Candidatus Lokiarchaeota archaeon]
MVMSKSTEYYINIDYDISLDRQEELIKLANRYIGYESSIWSASINGYVVKLKTNNLTFDEFFRDNFFPAHQIDEELRPHGTIYAVSGIFDTEPGIYYNQETKTAILFNIDDYYTLRSVALGIVLDVSEEQNKLSFIRGSLVDVNGDGFVFMGRKGAGISTHSFLLLETNLARIHSVDWIYLERLGGQLGRLSTLSSERKILIKNEIASISQRINILSKKCKKNNRFMLLDPWWIGGEEKHIDTTRIKVILFLYKDNNDKKIGTRIDSDEALNMLEDAESPFFNPHTLVYNEERRELKTKFFKTIFKHVAMYKVNTTHSIFDIQRWIQNLIESKEYQEPLKEESKEAPIDKDIKNIIEEIDYDDLLSCIKKLKNKNNVINPNPKELEQMAKVYGTKTKWGSYNFVSTVKNRSAPLTIIIGKDKVHTKNLTKVQKELFLRLPKTLNDVKNYLQKGSFVVTERVMGNNDHFTPKCILYCSIHRKEMVHLSFMFDKSLFRPQDVKSKGPKLYLIDIPEWHEMERQILVFPEIGLTIALGSDYYGEVKKAFLRMAMWFAKQRGMLGLHSGAKLIKANDAKTNEIKRYSTLIFGLTATGKTTHSCHSHNLNKPGEGIEIVQDDFVALRKDGSILGTERGFFLKTEGISPEIQKLIYNVVTKPSTIFENVLVDYKGKVYFHDETLTGNGRGIMQRTDFGDAIHGTINLPSISELDGLIILMITRRNTIVPIAAKLTIEQAALAFALGESIHTSGSDPRRAGESIRIVGTNPFIVGDKAEEVNIFYNMIKSLPEEKLRCFQINTGGIGEIREKDEYGRSIVKRKVERIPIDEMANIIRGIARDSIKWKPEPYFGTLIPEDVEGVDMSKYDPQKFYSEKQIDKLVRELKEERIKYISKLKGLNRAIIDALF